MVISYIVHEGDTMANISRMFSVDFDVLVSQNGGEGLNVSSVIFIPVAWRQVLPHPVKHGLPSVAHVGKLDNLVLLGLSMAIVGMLAIGLSLEIRQKYERLPKGDKQSPCIELLQAININASIDENKPVMYSPQVVKQATQNFSSLFYIGGSVYRGTINGNFIPLMPNMVYSTIFHYGNLRSKMDYGFMVERVVSMQTTHYQFLTGIEPLSVCVRKGV